MWKMVLPTILMPLALLNSGCLVFQKQNSMGCEWNGDPAFTLKFYVFDQRNVVLRDAKHNFTELSLTLESATEHAGGLVARQPCTPDDRELAMFMDGYEARVDPGHRRFWVVRDGKVMATLDRDTGRTTGPSDTPPEWAKPEAGEIMWINYPATSISSFRPQDGRTLKAET
jgi:hypothetical protein